MSPDIRVHELATELGMTSRDLLRVLETQQVYVRSASSRLDTAAANRIRTYLKGQRTRPPRAPVTDSRNPFAARSAAGSPQPIAHPVSRAQRPAPSPRHRPSDTILEAAQMFGVDPASLREKKVPRPRDAGRPEAGSATTQGSLAVELSRRFRLSPEQARAVAEPWAMLLLSTDELTLRRFWDAGFDHTHHRQIEQCLAEGIGPDDLDERVDGRRVGEHILSGGPIRYLAIRLRNMRS